MVYIYYFLQQEDLDYNVTVKHITKPTPHPPSITEGQQTLDRQITKGKASW